MLHFISMLKLTIMLDTKYTVNWSHFHYYYNFYLLYFNTNAQKSNMFSGRSTFQKNFFSFTAKHYFNSGHFCCKFPENFIVSNGPFRSIILSFRLCPGAFPLVHSGSRSHGHLTGGFTARCGGGCWGRMPEEERMEGRGRQATDRHEKEWEWVRIHPRGSSSYGGVEFLGRLDSAPTSFRSLLHSFSNADSDN